MYLHARNRLAAMSIRIERFTLLNPFFLLSLTSPFGFSLLLLKEFSHGTSRRNHGLRWSNPLA